MRSDPMYHYTMDGNTSGQYVVTVGSDGKLMQVREPLFMPTQSGVPTLAGGKREELHTNAMPGVTVKNDVYQYVMNAASGSGQYMGLMTLGPDGKLISVRNDRTNLPHVSPATSAPPPSRIIEINAFSNSKNTKPALLQAHQPQQQIQLQNQPQNPQEQQAIQQQQQTALQQQTQSQQLQQPQDQQPAQQEQQPQSQPQRQMHQQVLRSDKIVKGEREVVCAKSCRACCNIDDSEDSVDVSRYMQQGAKDGNDSSSTTSTTRTWPTSTASYSQNIEASNNSGPPKARFQCKVCLKMFTQKVNLTTHERIHLGERPYQCKVCLKSFTQQSNLVTHERIHTGERPYQCNVCLKRFTQRQNLTAHERIHLGERPFQCQICQKSFTQRQNLTAHERIHLGERPFQCQICLKSFTQQQNLTAHERIHSSERHFTCSVCQKSFTQEANLSKHMQTHTGERSFQCQVCQRTFAQQSSLTAHERVHSSPDRRRKAYTFQIMRQQTSDDQPSDLLHTEQKEPSQQDNQNDDSQMQC